MKRAQSPVKSNASQPGYESKPKAKENVNGDASQGQSHEKVDGAGKDGEKSDANGTEEDKHEPNGLDESAYEINADELKDEEEEKAEAEMQPKKE